jgi:hypothetical protein
MKIRAMVYLNGTNENPYHRFGLLRNPFPYIAKSEFGGFNKILADLAANPIKDADDLRARMKGCSQEFIDGCVERFRPGELVKFEIEFPY